MQEVDADLKRGLEDTIVISQVAASTRKGTLDAMADKGLLGDELPKKEVANALVKCDLSQSIGPVSCGA